VSPETLEDAAAPNACRAEPHLLGPHDVDPRLRWFARREAQAPYALLDEDHGHVHRHAPTLAEVQGPRAPDLHERQFLLHSPLQMAREVGSGGGEGINGGAREQPRGHWWLAVHMGMASKFLTLMSGASAGGSKPSLKSFFRSGTPSPV
jgi:hypothetical protein